MHRIRIVRRRALAAALSLCLLVSLLSLPAGASSTPYFLVVNDNLPESSVYTAPIYVNGITYIPCTVFSSQYTGVSFGISYHWSKQDEIVSLSNTNVVLEFNLSSGLVTDYPGRKQYNYLPALMRNGLPYLPATQACNFFGLKTTYLESEGCHILRIKNGSEVLDDTLYLQSAKPILDSWVGRQSVETPAQPSVPDPPPAPAEAEHPAGENSSIFLALRVKEGRAAGSMLHSLRQRGGKAIFFFPADQLPDHLDRMIDVINQGSRIGLIAQGSDAAAQRESIEQGAQQLSSLLHQRVYFVLHENLKDDAAASLKEEGFILWAPRLRVSAAGRGGGQVYESTLESIHQLKGVTRLLVTEDVPAGTLSSILRQLRSELYPLWSPSETFY